VIGEEKKALTADLYIVSDLHLSEGLSADGRRFSRLESFFFDQEFSNFLGAAAADSESRGSRARLILNGDIFDFLATKRVPKDEEVFEGETVTATERKYGLSTTAMKSAWKMRCIVRGHRVFFDAIIQFMQRGHEVTLIRGNHDVELFWPEVQEALFQEMEVIAEEIVDDEPSLNVRARMNVEHWFYLEKGRIFVEHGHQYDSGNSFRFNLAPIMPKSFDENGRPVLDYPTGSLFVRYMFNKMKLVDPFSSFVVSFDKYFFLLGRARFLDLLGALGFHLPFFLRTIKKARFFELEGTEPIRASHDTQLEKEAESAAVPTESLEAIDSLMSEPVGKTKYSLVQEFTRPLVRTILTVAAIAIVSLSAWFIVFSSIQSITWTGGVVVRSSLLALLSVLSFVGLFLTFTTLHRRLGMRGDKWGDILFEKAERISSILDVPLVSMGHTHEASYRPFRKREGGFANSGTWIRQSGPWDVIKPGSHQFTFVRVTGLDMDVMRWVDASDRWESVPLMEEYDPSTLERILTDEDAGA